MKRIPALLLSTALLITPALAAEDKFPSVRPYTGYSDVKESDWFYDTAKLCTEIGLMNGTEKGFEPTKSLSGPECAALAARLREQLTGKAIPATVPGGKWYDNYVSYLKDAAQESGSSLYGSIKWSDTALFEQPATRYDFLVFMALAAEGQEDYFPAINTIACEDLPDIGNDTVILRFYNIGILTGTDKYGTFAADKNLTRAEAAAMVARMAKPELRKQFVPADYSMFTAAYMSPDTVLFDNGVSAELFLPILNDRIAYWENQLGDAFNWQAEVNGQTLLKQIKAETLAHFAVTEAQATAAFQNLDYQVYYSRLLDLTGTLLGGAI